MIATFVNPSTLRTISRFLDVKNKSIVDTRSCKTASSRSDRNSYSILVRAVTVAEIICGALPARPAETMVKYSSRDAFVAEASAAM